MGIPIIHVCLGGKNPSHGPAFPFRLLGTVFLGLFSPVAAVTTLTIAFKANTSIGRVRTGSRHVGHVY
jgi:hypothetical protein